MIRIAVLAFIMAIPFESKAEKIDPKLPVVFASLELGTPMKKMQLTHYKNMGGRGCRGFVGTKKYQNINFRMELDFSYSEGAPKLASISTGLTEDQAIKMSAYLKMFKSSIKEDTVQKIVLDDGIVTIELTKMGKAYGFGMLLKRLKCDGGDYY
jgi:hypothetical protein